MTILEALNVDVNNAVLSEKNLIKVGITDSTVEYTSTIDATIELAKAYCYKSLLGQPDWGEDGQNAEYSRSDLKKEANRIFELNGLTDELINSVNVIYDISGQW